MEKENARAGEPAVIQTHDLQAVTQSELAFKRLDHLNANPVAY